MVEHKRLPADYFEVALGRGAGFRNGESESSSAFSYGPHSELFIGIKVLTTSSVGSFE
jgi:hypothetical protein